jgi:hypothetical protein
MPAPTLPIKIAVKCASLTTGESVKIINRTQEEIIRANVDESGSVIVNPADYGYTWANDDSLVFEISGRLIGNSTGTISKNKVSTTITGTADTSSPAVSL